MKFSIREIFLLIVIVGLVVSQLQLRSKIGELNVLRGRLILLQHLFEEQGMEFEWDATGLSYQSNEEDGLLVVSPRGSMHTGRDLRFATEKDQFTFAGGPAKSR